MLFFFKKKKIVVDCFTAMESVYNLYKIRKAITYFPEQIKALPTYIEVKTQNGNVKQKISTLKICNGLTELYKVGFIIPMWADFIANPKTAAAGQSALGVMSRHYFFESHPIEQYEGLYRDHMHVKLVSPWRFKETTGAKFTWNAASWNHQEHANNFIINPGVLWFDTQSTTNINMFINKKAEDFTIHAGTPMVHVVPVSDAEVVIKNHLVCIDEWVKLDAIPNDYHQTSFNRLGSYYKDLEKSNEMDRKESKCPFGFGKK
jgi:hypothetical protein